MDNLKMADNTSHLAMEINDDMRDAVLPVTIFVALEAVLGFFGNMIVLYVFFFRYHACNFRYFVLCLASVDITSTLTTMPGEVVTQLFWFIYPLPMICKIKSFFNVFTVSAEALCLLTIAVDRYRKLCQPLAWQITHRVAFILCLVIYAVSAVLAFPVALFWGTHSYIKSYHRVNVTVTVCEKDHKYVEVNSPRPLQYSIAVQVLMSLWMFLLFCIYIFVARTLLKSRSKSMDQSTSSMPPPGESTTVRRTIRDVSDYEYSSTDTDLNLSDNTTRAVQSNADEVVEVNDIKTNLSVPQAYKVRGQIHDVKNKSPSNTVHTFQLKTDIDSRKRRKTLIMLILTVVFIVTTVLYLTLLSMIADDVLQQMSDSEKALYFFFFRLYFVNHVINPVVYGLLDPQFRRAVHSITQSLSSMGTSTIISA